ncbi:Putative uncharacterized protein [Leuconostoc citreum]|nr:Putative uncharacterized protein [Leuconostoc citreum]
MTRKAYGELEHKVISLFSTGTKFNWKNESYTVVLSDKPRAKRGEPKTDVYILASKVTDSKQYIEFKISCKLLGKNEFQENKITAERAKQIWGENWSDILTNSFEEISDKFHNTKVYFPVGSGRTKETQFTNGWKVEIASKARELSRPLNLTSQEIRNYIYKGTTLDISKKNALVDGKVIINSGVAEYMLVINPASINSTSDVLKSIILIDEYEIVPHYIIFTANNFRVLENKSDGNRPLGVQVLWSADLAHNKMIYSIDFSHPLDSNYSGKAISERTMNEINKLGLTFTKKFI